LSTRGTSQDGAEVMRFERTMLIHRQRKPPNTESQPRVATMDNNSIYTAKLTAPGKAAATISSGSRPARGMFAVQPLALLKALGDARVAKAVTRLISIVLIAANVTALAGIQSTQARQLPRQAIVRGQNLQPRENDLKSLGITDVSPQQAAEIDKLYRELLHCSRCGVPTNPSANG
jgi:hypothetical protein